jgi:O-antigen/teichoic acid export membrane protein
VLGKQMSPIQEPVPAEVSGAGESSPQHLAGRTRGGAVWVVSSFGLGQVLRLGSNIILAAILMEDVFALMAIVTAVMVGLGMFSDIGLQTSVVQNSRGDEPDFLNTVWTLQILRGLVLFTATVLLAIPVSQFYGANDPNAYELRYLIPLVGLTALFEGLHSARLMTAARHLRIKEVTLIDFVVGPFSVILMVGLAWWMRSVYALAIASVLTSALNAYLSYRMLEGPRSRLCWNREVLRSVISFGKWIFLSTLITFLALQLDRLAMARFFPLVEVGVYSIAASLAVVVPTLVGRLQWSILFPWYSRMLEQGMSLPAAFARTRMASMVLASFLCSLLVAGSESFFDLAYDDRYAMGGVFLPILAVGAWFSCLENMYGSVFVASGRPKWTALTNVSKVVVFGLLLIPVAVFDLDIVAAAQFLAASELVRWLICHVLGHRLGLRNTRVELGMLALFLTVSLAGWWLVERVSMIAELHPFWRLAVLGCAISLLFAPLFYRHVLPLVRPRPT